MSVVLEIADYNCLLGLYNMPKLFLGIVWRGEWIGWHIGPHAFKSFSTTLCQLINALICYG